MCKASIGIASDHAGPELKRKIIDFLKEKGYNVLNFGTDSGESVDYPDYAAEVAGRISRGEIPLGILICGTGIGMSITANKFPGVRAALVYDEFTAQMSREHNDANILVLGARALPEEKLLKLVEIWMNTQFAGDRHQRRISRITDWENRIRQDQY